MVVLGSWNGLLWRHCPWFVQRWSAPCRYWDMMSLHKTSTEDGCLIFRMENARAAAWEKEPQTIDWICIAGFLFVSLSVLILVTALFDDIILARWSFTDHALYVGLELSLSFSLILWNVWVVEFEGQNGNAWISRSSCATWIRHRARRASVLNLSVHDVLIPLFCTSCMHSSREQSKETSKLLVHPPRRLVSPITYYVVHTFTLVKACKGSSARLELSRVPSIFPSADSLIDSLD